MRDLALTKAARAARNEASIAQADAGSGVSSVKFYTAAGGSLVAVRTLAKPCGTVRSADARIELHPASANDLVVTSGAANWGEWCAADGTVLAVGAVTDADGMASDGAGGLIDTGGIGPWVLTGTNGTLLYQGGIVLLTSGLVG